jgi:hypothetical protein
VNIGGYIRRILTSFLGSDLLSKKNSVEWSFEKGKLYKVKEGIRFAVHIYDEYKCLYKPNQLHSIDDNVFSGDIVMYVDDVYVSENPNEEKIYCRPLFLRGERLYVTRHDALWSHYVSDDVIGFNEILEKI